MCQNSTCQKVKRFSAILDHLTWIGSCGLSCASTHSAVWAHEFRQVFCHVSGLGLAFSEIRFPGRCAKAGVWQSWRVKLARGHLPLVVPVVQTSCDVFTHSLMCESGLFYWLAGRNLAHFCWSAQVRIPSAVSCVLLCCGWSPSIVVACG